MSTDIDDSIVFADLLRSGEVSRLRRRGAMRIHDRHDHFDDMPSLQSVSSSSDGEWDSDSDGRPERWSEAFGSKTYELSCGAPCPRSVMALPTQPFKPSPIPWSPPSSQQLLPPLQASTGCGSSVCSSAIYHRSAFISTWRQQAVPVDLCYIPPQVFDRTEPIESRYIRSECGCFRTGLSCACCGNAIGIIYNPCSSARSRLDLDAAIHRRFKTIYVFFPTDVTPSTLLSSSPSPSSDLFTLHLPHSPSVRAPFASTLGQNNTPRPLTPPRPRQRHIDEDYDDIAWGNAREETEHPHFTLPGSYDNAVPVGNQSSPAESGETLSDPLAWARSYLGEAPQTIRRQPRVVEDDDDGETPFIPPPRRRNAYLTTASSVSTESRLDASFDPNRWLLDREGITASPLATFGELPEEDDDDDDDDTHLRSRRLRTPVRMSIMAGPAPSELASPPQESPPPFVWGPNPFVRSTSHPVPIELDSSEADMIGYDVGEEVMVGLRRVVVDAAGEFLSTDKEPEDDEKEGSAYTTPRLQGC